MSNINRKIELAKKIFGNEFLNTFKIIKSYKELPKDFKRF